MRTLESHLAYYERWAKSWEFQALLKARPLAGDANSARATSTASRRWCGRARAARTSSSRCSACASGSRRTSRADEVDVQIKLGPGGLRDVEFTVQLLQLVHGATDAAIRQRGTLAALSALAEHGYVGRDEAAEFARDYRFLRVLEHRIQLDRLRRTHLMPRDERSLRVLARATGLARNAAELRRCVADDAARGARAARAAVLPPAAVGGRRAARRRLTLTSEQAEARLAAIGFRDPRGALRHIAALTAGVSRRRARIQRHLLPVLHLVVRRRRRPRLRPARVPPAVRRPRHDALVPAAAARLVGRRASAHAVLSGSRFVAVLLERIPEAVAWLEDDDELRPRSLVARSKRAARRARAARGRRRRGEDLPRHPSTRGAATGAGRDPRRLHRRGARAWAQRRDRRTTRRRCWRAIRGDEPTASSSASSRWAASAARELGFG